MTAGISGKDSIIARKVVAFSFFAGSQIPLLTTFSIQPKAIVVDDDSESEDSSTVSNSSSRSALLRKGTDTDGASFRSLRPQARSPLQDLLKNPSTSLHWLTSPPLRFLRLSGLKVLTSLSWNEPEVFNYVEGSSAIPRKQQYSQQYPNLVQSICRPPTVSKFSSTKLDMARTVCWWILCGDTLHVAFRYAPFIAFSSMQGGVR